MSLRCNSCDQVTPRQNYNGNPSDFKCWNCRQGTGKNCSSCGKNHFSAGDYDMCIGCRNGQTPHTPPKVNASDLITCQSCSNTVPRGNFSGKQSKFKCGACRFPSPPKKVDSTNAGKETKEGCYYCNEGRCTLPEHQKVGKTTPAKQKKVKKTVIVEEDSVSPWEINLIPTAAPPTPLPSPSLSGSAISFTPTKKKSPSVTENSTDNETKKQQKESKPLIVIDGANIGHYNTTPGKVGVKFFSSDQLRKAVTACLKNGLQPRILLPQHYLDSKHKDNVADDVEILLQLEKDGFLVRLPSNINDDLPIIDLAKHKGAFILTNDGFKDHVESGLINSEFIKARI